MGLVIFKHSLPVRTDSSLTNQGHSGSVSGIREAPLALEVGCATQSPQQLLRPRFQQLIIFLALEGLWLGFGLIVYFYPIHTPSGEQVFVEFRGENKKLDAHNLDLEETSRMLGHSLNGIPWDTVVVTAQNTPSKLSRLAAELLFLPPELDFFNTFSIYAPQSVENISASLNAYTSIAGMSAYLDGSGSVGFVQVATFGFTNRQKLVIAWPQWLTSVAIVVSITVLVVILTIRDSRKKERLVPLTVNTVTEEYRKLLSQAGKN